MITKITTISSKHNMEIKYIMFYLVLLAFFLIIAYKKKEWIEKIYKHRFLTAFIIFSITVIFQVSGSSIGIWNNFFGTTETINKGVLLGKSQGIRSDEWATFTIFNFSQKYNTLKPFSFFSNSIRADKTDLFLEYGGPVLDIGIIYRIFQVGYILFGNSRGLAFFWNARFIMLIMVTFELMMIITNKKKKLSLLGTMLIALSPIVSWWFSINGLVEMLISMQLAIVLLDKYMLETNFKKRILYLIGIAISAGTFLFAFYPSWEIPLAYVTAGLGIWIIIKNYKKCKIYKRDIISIGIIVSIFGITLGYLLTKSWNTIEIILNTVYPGSRLEIGGGCIAKLFEYPINTFFNINNRGLLSNTCEEAVFFDIFPLGLIFTIIVLIKQKKKDVLLIILTILDVFFGIWLIFGFPKIIAKITLLSNSQASRTYLAFGIINIMMLIRALALFEVKVTVRKSLILSIFLSTIVTALTYKYYSYYLYLYMIIIIYTMLLVLFYLIFRINKKIEMNLLLISIFSISIISSLIVNPIRVGTDVIYEQPIVKQIESIIDKDKEGKWIVEGLGYPYINIPIMVGAPTINCTNVYPDLDRWKLIDKNEKYGDVYNRYAHITINLQTDKDSSFELMTPDSFITYLNVDDLDVLDVRYILTPNSLEKYSSEKIKFELIGQENIFKIYKIN